MNETTTTPIIDKELKCYDGEKTIYNCTCDDDGNIHGYTEDGTKAKYSLNHSKWFYGSNIGASNLIPMDKRSKEEVRRIASKGGSNTWANYHNEKERQRNINDIAKAMLEKTLSDKSVSEILGEGVEMLDDKSVASVMVAKMIQTACAGSFKAFETVRDTAGYKPKNEVEVTADIMTDSDKALIENLRQRIG